MEKQNFFEKDGTKYFRLYVACPVCRERGVVTPQSYWFHTNDDCNGSIFIGDNAHFYCEKCGAEEHILRCKRSNSCCNSEAKEATIHFGIERENAYNSINKVLSIIGMMVTATGQQWLIKCLENLGN